MSQSNEISITVSKKAKTIIHKRKKEDTNPTVNKRRKFEMIEKAHKKRFHEFDTKKFG